MNGNMKAVTTVNDSIDNKSGHQKPFKPLSCFSSQTTRPDPAMHPELPGPGAYQVKEPVYIKRSRDIQ